MLNLIIFGPPGVGKGTQAKKIATHYHLMHISTGDILRAETECGSDLGVKVKEIISSGELVPDNILIGILENTFENHHSGAGFIFDGFPRTLPQATALNELMERKNTRIGQVLTLEVHEEELLRRLVNRANEEGRMDDTEEVIRNRLKVYHKHTKPLIDYYKQQGIYTEVPGVGSIDEIFRKLCRIIDQFR